LTNGKLRRKAQLLLRQASQDLGLARQDLIALEFTGSTKRARGAAFPV
jgi:hypothetical protein